MLQTITRRLSGLVAVCLRKMHFHARPANIFTALIEKHAVHQSPKRIDELVKIFIHATKVRTKTLIEDANIHINACTDGDRFLGYGWGGLSDSHPCNLP